MLYDQALTSVIYTEAHQATGDPFYRKVSEEIIDYVLTVLTSPEGGFYSAEDADSEGEEGKFYLWTENEIKKILSPEKLRVFIEVYNIKKAGNYKDELTKSRTGKNILHMKKTLANHAKKLGITEESLRLSLEQSKKKLLGVRDTRVRPHLDDKILTSWNGLMLAALAKAGRVFQEPSYTEAARKNVEFILTKLTDSKDRLLRRYRDGDASIQGFLDDYAFLIWGLLEMYETTFEIKYLKLAINFSERMIPLFWDESEGGFFFSSGESDDVLVRSKDIYDGAKPSGNSVALLNLIRISKVRGVPDYNEKISALIDRFSDQVHSSPMSYTFFMSALNFVVGPSYEIIVAGKLDSEDTRKMLQTLNQNYLPNKVVLHKPLEEVSEIADIANYTTNYRSLEGKATAYVCINQSCQLPVTSASDLLEFLEKPNM
jgi:uncharacterized protein YyaL (SSP411 family)